MRQVNLPREWMQVAHCSVPIDMQSSEPQLIQKTKTIKPLTVTKDEISHFRSNLNEFIKFTTNPCPRQIEHLHRLERGKLPQAMQPPAVMQTQLLQRSELQQGRRIFHVTALEQPDLFSE